MTPIVITVPHRLGKAEALRRIKPMFEKSAELVPALQFDSQTWSEDRMDFRASALGQAITGNVVASDTDVRVEVALPWLLSGFGETVRKTITDRSREALER